ERVEAAMSRQIARGTGVLATIGATAPFVGLFGTVWGIMNSFIGISEAHTTNLAVVAPGIAEALLATALGLVAAIPAVVIYNHLTRTIAAHRALLGDASAMLLLLISREGDRGAFRRARPADLHAGQRHAREKGRAHLSARRQGRQLWRPDGGDEPVAQRRLSQDRAGRPRRSQLAP